MKRILCIGNEIANQAGDWQAHKGAFGSELEEQISPNPANHALYHTTNVATSTKSSLFQHAASNNGMHSPVYHTANHIAHNMLQHNSTFSPPSSARDRDRDPNKPV